MEEESEKTQVNSDSEDSFEDLVDLGESTMATNRTEMKKAMFDVLSDDA